MRLFLAIYVLAAREIVTVLSYLAMHANEWTAAARPFDLTSHELAASVLAPYVTVPAVLHSPAFRRTVRWLK